VLHCTKLVSRGPAAGPAAARKRHEKPFVANNLAIPPGSGAHMARRLQGAHRV